MSAPDGKYLNLLIRTLSAAGFLLTRVERCPTCALTFMERLDEFGIFQKYCFAISDGSPFDEAASQAALIPARKQHAQLIFVGSSAPAGLRLFGRDEFLNIVGGPVLDQSPLSPEFRSQLIQLGGNSLPAGLNGKPDELFEAYVREALAFIMGTKTIRYGQDRLFEAVPDGVVLAYQDFAALFDAKAYADGYNVTEDSIRQFKSYVEDFKRRYSSFVTLKSFIVISQKFKQQAAALNQRSQELIAECQVPLAFLTAETLCDVLDAIKQQPNARHSIKWPRIFASPIVQLKHVKAELDTIAADRVAPHIN